MRASRHCTFCWVRPWGGWRSPELCAFCRGRTWRWPEFTPPFTHWCPCPLWPAAALSPPPLSFKYNQTKQRTKPYQTKEKKGMLRLNDKAVFHCFLIMGMRVFIDCYWIRKWSRTRFRQVLRGSLAEPEWSKLYAGVHAGDPIAQRVHAGKFGVGVSHVFQSSFAALQFLLKWGALRSADFDEVVFGVLSLLQHCSDCAFDVAHK